MITFKFADKDSFTDYGIIVTKRPVIPSPKRRVNYIDVPGRDSSLRFDENTFEDITIAVECIIKGTNATAKIDTIKSWLFLAGEKDLIFSFQTNKKFRAQVINSIDFKDIFRQFCSFIIVFNCQPFKYGVDNSVLTISNSSGTTINYPGSYAAKPIVKVYGKGDGTFKIKNREVKMKGIIDHLIVNSEIEEAYYMNSTTMVNGNNLMTGEFPILENGSNSVTFSGGVTKLEVTANTRWL